MTSPQALRAGQRQPAQVLVLFALALVGLVAILGMVLDGSTLYVQRRTAQNAADAAAMAGARALARAATNPTGAVGTAICEYLLDNAFGITPSGSAHFVGTNGAALPGGTIGLPANCSGGVGSTFIPAGAAGVHVDATIGPYATYLSGVVGIRELSAAATATAQVGRLSIPRPPLIPLVGCGTDMLTDGSSGSPNYNILTASNTINYDYLTSPLPRDFVLQGSQLAQNSNSSCPAWNGSSSAWKGKVDISGYTGPVAPPLSMPVDTGNGSISGQLVAACVAVGGRDPTNLLAPAPTGTGPDHCLLLVPIAAPPHNANMANVVTLACFSIYEGNNGAEKWRGILHHISDSRYGVYTPTWTFGGSADQTTIILTQ